MGWDIHAYFDVNQTTIDEIIERGKYDKHKDEGKIADTFKQMIGWELYLYYSYNDACSLHEIWTSYGTNFIRKDEALLHVLRNFLSFRRAPKICSEGGCTETRGKPTGQPTCSSTTSSPPPSSSTRICDGVFSSCGRFGGRPAPCAAEPRLDHARQGRLRARHQVASRAEQPARRAAVRPRRAEQPPEQRRESASPSYPRRQVAGGKAASGSTSGAGRRGPCR